MVHTVVGWAESVVWDEYQEDNRFADDTTEPGHQQSCMMRTLLPWPLILKSCPLCHHPLAKCMSPTLSSLLDSVPNQSLVQMHLNWHNLNPIGTPGISYTDFNLPGFVHWSGVEEGIRHASP